MGWRCVPIGFPSAEGELGDNQVLRQMGGWSSCRALVHYVAAGREQRRRMAERF
jgi:hypothetical protein